MCGMEAKCHLVQHFRRRMCALEGQKKVGYRDFDFKENIGSHEIISSKESGVYGGKETKESDSCTIASKSQAKGSEAKTATQVGHSVTP